MAERPPLGGANRAGSVTRLLPGRPPADARDPYIAGMEDDPMDGPREEDGPVASNVARAGDEAWMIFVSLALLATAAAWTAVSLS